MKSKFNVVLVSDSKVTLGAGSVMDLLKNMTQIKQYIDGLFTELEPVTELETFPRVIITIGQSDIVPDILVTQSGSTLSFDVANNRMAEFTLDMKKSVVDQLRNQPELGPIMFAIANYYYGALVEHYEYLKEQLNAATAGWGNKQPKLITEDLQRLEVAVSAAPLSVRVLAGQLQLSALLLHKLQRQFSYDVETMKALGFTKVNDTVEILDKVIVATNYQTVSSRNVTAKINRNYEKLKETAAA